MANRQFGKFTETLAGVELRETPKQRKRNPKKNKGSKKKNPKPKSLVNDGGGTFVTEDVQPKRGQKAASAQYGLGEKDWENEVATKILTIYRSDVEQKNPGEQQSDRLPAVHQKKGQVNGSIHNYVPRHIWFAGTGAVRAMWCALIPIQDAKDQLVQQIPTMFECHHELCVKLRTLEKAGLYTKYVTLVETLLRKRTHEHGCCVEDIQDEEDRNWGLIDPSVLAKQANTQNSDRLLWQQLIVCLNVFGEKLADLGKYGASLQVLKQSEALLTNDPLLEGSGFLDGPIRHQLQGYLLDSMSYYYFKRKKFNAAAVYSTKALKKHTQVKSWEHVAKCYLHGGAILAMMNKHEDSVRCMKQVLGLLENGKLEHGGTNSQKICLVAVCYHNIAVEQLVLHRVSDACISSQNARRLARMSLSYSNRWLSRFEATHQEALRVMMSRDNAATKLFGQFASGKNKTGVSAQMAKSLFS